MTLLSQFLFQKDFKGSETNDLTWTLYKFQSTTR